MRAFFLTVAVAWAAQPLLAEPADVGGKPAASRIVAVTVYQTNALVTRTVDVPEGAGTIELVVSPLPPETVPSSLYAEGTDGIRVLNSRFRTRAIREDTRDEVRKLQAQIKQLAQEAQRLQADIKTANENQQFLTKLEAFTGATMQHLTEKGLLSADTTIALAKYVMSTRAERSKELVALQQQLQANAEQGEFAKRQLSELTSGVQRTERDAVIVVDKANAAAGTVRLNYLVGAVAWRPQYKLRAGKDKDPVSLEYLATVRQQTGEDWTGVALALSTAQPMLNASPPELKSLEVSAIAASAPNPMGIGQPGMPGTGGGGRSGKDVYKELQLRAGESRAQSQQLSNTLNWVEAGKVINEAAALEQFGDLMATRDEIVMAKRELGEAVNDGPSVTFRLRTKLTLPSRNDVQTLEVSRIELAPDFFYKAVPVLTPHVYREANLTNKSDFVLLPGEATMYLGTDFVGRAELPLVAIGKQFTVGFGVDPQLQASRQLLNKTRTTTGGNQVLTFDYRILVNSYKTEPVRLQVWDRMPKAEVQAVAVSLVSQKPDVSTDPLYLREDRPKNLLRWDMTAQPTQNGEKALAIDYQFKLELDKNMQIGAVAAK
jgi:hypothetical protein